MTQIERYKVQQDVAVKELARYPVEYFEQWVIGSGKAIGGTSLTLINIALNIPPSNISFDGIQKINIFNKSLGLSKRTR